MASACIVLSADGTMLQVNPAFERMFELRASEVAGRPALEFVHLPRFREEVVTRLEALRADPESSYSGVHENITARGRAIVCRWNAASLRSRDGAVHGFVVMADDITEVVRAEHALRTSEARYRALSDISPVGIFRVDLAGQLRVRQSARRWDRGARPGGVAGARLVTRGARGRPACRDGGVAALRRERGTPAICRRVPCRPTRRQHDLGLVAGDAGARQRWAARRPHRHDHRHHGDQAGPARVTAGARPARAARARAHAAARGRQGRRGALRSRQVDVPLDDVARAAHAAQLDPRVHGRAAAGVARAADGRTGAPAAARPRRLDAPAGSRRDVLDVSRIEAGQVGLDYRPSTSATWSCDTPRRSARSRRASASHCGSSRPKTCR